MIEVGTILTYAYHYNARYPQFVRVTRVSPKSIWVEKLNKMWATCDGYGQNGEVIPNLEGPATPVKGCFRLKNNSYWGEYVKIDGCYATVWNGQPETEYTD